MSVKPEVEPNTKQMEVRDESHFQVLDITLTRLSVVLLPFISKKCRCKLQYCVSIALQGFVGLPRGSNATSRGSPVQVLGENIIVILSYLLGVESAARDQHVSRLYVSLQVVRLDCSSTCRNRVLTVVPGKILSKRAPGL